MLVGSYFIDNANLYETGQPDFQSRVCWWQVLTFIDIADLYETGQPDFKSQVGWWWILTMLTLPIYKKLNRQISNVEFLGGSFLLY